MKKWIKNVFTILFGPSPMWLGAVAAKNNDERESPYPFGATEDRQWLYGYDCEKELMKKGR